MNVFTLWGELKADTRSFDAALIRADREIKSTEQSLSRLENSTKRYGASSATVARQQEKLNEAVAATKKRLADATHAYDQGALSHRKMATVLTQTSSRLDQYNSKIKDSTARMKDFHAANAGAEFMSIARGAAIATVAIGGFAMKAAMDIENSRNKFTALEGSVEKANLRIKSLLNLSRGSVGVNFTDALQAFGQLKVLGTVSDQAIEKMIQGLGRLRLAFDNSMGSTQDFLLNLQQLFDQGFEAQDWKQAIGRVQIFEQLVEKAFGTKDPEKLRKLKEAGQLTMETWVAGFADAANNDARLAGLSETFSVKLSKMLTEVNLNAAPLGQKIIDAIKPAFDSVLTELQKDNPDYIAAGTKLGERIGEGVGAGLAKAFANLPSFTDALVDKFKPPTSGTTPIFLAFGSSVIKALMQGLRSIDTTQYWNQLRSSWLFTITTIGARMPLLGAMIVQGLINGVKSKMAEAEGTMRAFAGRMIAAAQSPGGFWINSPSKHFIEIGKSVGEGLVVGIEKMHKPVETALMKLINSVSPKNIDKEIKKQMADLQKSLGEVLTSNAATVKGYSQALPFEVEAAAAKKMQTVLRDLIDKRIELGKNLDKPLIAGPAAVKELEYLNNIKIGADLIKDISDDLLKIDQTELQKLNEVLAGPAAQAYFAEMNPLLAEQLRIKLQLAAVARDYATLADGFKPLSESDINKIKPMPSGKRDLTEPILDLPPIDLWSNFWGMMSRRMEEYRDSLPSLKEAIGENLIASIENIGAVFGDAVGQWIETGESFFKSIAAGFRRMAAQIIGELVRLMVFKFLMKMLGLAAGGGGASPLGTVAVPPPIPGSADGGFIRGRGTSTSDSILARLSNGEFVMKAKAVKQWGVGLLEQMNSGMMPAFAGGGMVGGSSYSSVSNSNSNVFHIHVGGGGNPRETIRNVKQAVREANAMSDRERMRNK